MDISVIENSIRKEASSVLWRVVLFIVYYVALVLLGIGLFYAAFKVSVLLVVLLSKFDHINFRVAFWMMVIWLAIWWFCIQIAWYLIKPLFTFHSSTDESRYEVKEKDCPDLFALIRDVAKATGNKMPKHVYLTTDVNACVFYNSTSIWAIFLPTRKNLEVGLGLLHGMNKDEVKAILGHEFGHFSQQTMRVGAISYRLLLIIQDMIEHAQEQQQKAALSRASASAVVKFFHLASGPISVITKITITFYKYVERKNRSLSRYMEFEADAVACRNIGAKPFVSSLCKLPVLSKRHSTYETVIAGLLPKNKYLPEYWRGYDLVDRIIADDEHLHLTCNDILTSEIDERSRYPSKVTVVDSWNTHPSIAERIESARQFQETDTTVDTTDAMKIVPGGIMNSVGALKQEVMAENMTTPVAWSSVREMSFSDFKDWVEKNFKVNRTPHFLTTFVNRDIDKFNLPAKEEMQEHVDIPFTEKNRKMLLEYAQGMEDVKILIQMMAEGAKEKKVIYNGGEPTDCLTAFNQQTTYLEPFLKRIKELDVDIYKYLWQRAENKSSIENIYWALFYSSDGLKLMEEMMKTVSGVRQMIAMCSEKGQDISLKEDFQAKLTKDFWTFMQSFDYEKVSRVCGKWESGGNTTVNQQLRKWHAFSSQENVPYLNTTDLFTMIEEVFQLLARINLIGRVQWIQKVTYAYKDVEDMEFPENELTECNANWTEFLQSISENTGHQQN